MDKASPSLGRDAVYKKTSRIKRLPAYLTVQFVRFFVGKAPDSDEMVPKKILKVQFASFLLLHLSLPSVVPHSPSLRSPSLSPLTHSLPPSFSPSLSPPLSLPPSLSPPLSLPSPLTGCQVHSEGGHVRVLHSATAGKAHSKEVKVQRS